MSTKKKIRKLSILTKQMMLIGAVVWVSIGIIVSFVTNTRRNDMVSMAGKESKAIATLLSTYIDADQHSQIKENNGECDEYQLLQKQLNSAMEASNIRYIYTLWTDGRNVYYGVDGDMQDTVPYGELFEEELSNIDEAFRGVTVVDDTYHKYGDETILTAYVPIFNENGDVEAVLACDFDATEVKDKITKAWNWLFFWSTSGLALSATALYIIVKSTVKKLLLLNDKIDELVSSNGDLTKDIDIKTGDEVELLADSVNALMKYIREVVVNIAHNSNKLDESSQLTLEQVNVVQDKITDISSVMEEMSAGMEETSASLNQISENVKNAGNAIEAIYNDAKTNSEVAQNTMNEASVVYEDAVKQRNESKEKAKEMAQIVNEKIEQSKAVERINDLTAEILNIASKTNLLSLNASIEAARAGDAGRGFAVVAGEIGLLAKSSSETAEQIKQINAEVLSAVNDLAKEAQAMISFMEDVAMQGYEKLLVTSGEYKQNMQNVNNTMLEFASQCEMLEKNAQQVAISVGDVNIAVEESTKGISTVTESAVDLTSTINDVHELAISNSNIAKSLEDEVHKFKY